MKSYREIIETAAAMLHGRLLDPRRYRIDTPLPGPREMRREGHNPHPVITCDDETMKLLCAVLLNLSGGGGTFTRWNAVSYRWLRYATLSYLVGRAHGRRLLFGLATKTVDLDAVSNDKPGDSNIGDFHWALRQLLEVRAIDIIHHKGEDYICPTCRILRFVAD